MTTTFKKIIKNINAFWRKGLQFKHSFLHFCSQLKNSISFYYISGLLWYYLLILGYCFFFFIYVFLHIVCHIYLLITANLNAGIIFLILFSNFFIYEGGPLYDFGTWDDAGWVGGGQPYYVVSKPKEDIFADPCNRCLRCDAKLFDYFYLHDYEIPSQVVAEFQKRLQLSYECVSPHNRPPLWETWNIRDFADPVYPHLYLNLYQQILHGRVAAALIAEYFSHHNLPYFRLYLDYFFFYDLDAARQGLPSQPWGDEFNALDPKEVTGLYLANLLEQRTAFEILINNANRLALVYLAEREKYAAGSWCHFYFPETNYLISPKLTLMRLEESLTFFLRFMDADSDCISEYERLERVFGVRDAIILREFFYSPQELIFESRRHTANALYSFHATQIITDHFEKLDPISRKDLLKHSFNDVFHRFNPWLEHSLLHENQKIISLAAAANKDRFDTVGLLAYLTRQEIVGATSTWPLDYVLNRLERVLTAYLGEAYTDLARYLALERAKLCVLKEMYREPLYSALNDFNLQKRIYRQWHLPVLEEYLYRNFDEKKYSLRDITKLLSNSLHFDHYYLTNRFPLCAKSAPSIIEEIKNNFFANNDPTLSKLITNQQQVYIRDREVFLDEQRELLEENKKLKKRDYAFLGTVFLIFFMIIFGSGDDNAD